jgi:heme/copper-type cytochrome/quinol oxidase subunit 2
MYIFIIVIVFFFILVFVGIIFIIIDYKRGNEKDGEHGLSTPKFKLVTKSIGLVIIGFGILGILTIFLSKKDDIIPEKPTDIDTIKKQKNEHNPLEIRKIRLENLKTQLQKISDSNRKGLYSNEATYRTDSILVLIEINALEDSIKNKK